MFNNEHTLLVQDLHKLIQLMDNSRLCAQ